MIRALPGIYIPHPKKPSSNPQGSENDDSSNVVTKTANLHSWLLYDFFPSFNKVWNFKIHDTCIFD